MNKGKKKTSRVTWGKRAYRSPQVRHFRLPGPIIMYRNYSVIPIGP